MTTRTTGPEWGPVDQRYFTGTGHLKMNLARPEIAVGTVVFEPGCRNNWHTHAVSQTLIVTDGLGLYQEEGKPARALRPGDVVYTAAGVNHWHGATSSTPMTHYAITLPDEDGSVVTWGDPVDGATYEAAHEALAISGVPVTAGRDRLGDFAPAFAAFNDDVLFGQVWSRTASLPARERSLVTVITLAASGITDSALDHHLAFAKANGVTKTDIVEALTHAAFYMGWPKAWAVLPRAKDVWGDEE